MQHIERHRSHRAGWLRAGVLGANDGIVSTASLVIGVAAADSGRTAVLTAGMAGLVAGALSMGVGEYVSVSSQRDTERADIAKERHELATTPERELAELTAIYRHKGLSPELARQVAEELSAGDVLKVHLAEELGITDDTMARPVQAMVVSTVSFAVGAALPLGAMAVASTSWRAWLTVSVALVALVALGSLGARLGGAPRLRAATRVLVGGAAAMALTALVGKLFGAAIG
jgi:VIT1/CCC1 family predicted Fe2+/Mn2+ transporter